MVKVLEVIWLLVLGPLSKLLDKLLVTVYLLVYFLVLVEAGLLQIGRRPAFS